MSDFLRLGIRPEILRALKAQGITEPTPVQKQAIPALLRGKDVIAQAQTGTGKTLAFVLPILQRIDPNVSSVQALIMTPTRELALQITTEVKKMVTYLEGVSVLAVYGGQDVERQMKRLKGRKQLVIGTPGRLLDHLRRGSMNLSQVSMLVLDEADQMLHMGFLEEVEAIIRETSVHRQTMLFSATMPQQIRSLAVRYMRKPEDIRVQSTQITLKGIKQIVVQTTERAKQETLRSLLDQYRPFLAVIFCRTKRRVSVLNEWLMANGYDSDELHGDLSQAKREQVMRRFREAKIQLLVATDVAARGLDVEGVTHVLNYDIPHDVESYIHRIGRTGRAGSKGLAITLAAPRDNMYLEIIEKGINLTLQKQGMEVHRRRNHPDGENKVVKGERGHQQRGRNTSKQPKKNRPQQKTARGPKNAKSPKRRMRVSKP